MPLSKLTNSQQLTGFRVMESLHLRTWFVKWSNSCYIRLLLKRRLSKHFENWSFEKQSTTLKQSVRGVCVGVPHDGAAHLKGSGPGSNGALGMLC